MPNTNEGLSGPDPAENVNTAAGFEAAMAARGIERDEGEGEATDTNVEAGITLHPESAPEDVPRDEKGRFVPRQAEPEAAPSDDRPEWLDAKYTSVEEQAKAYAEAQKLIGARDERASEAEQLRLELAELRGRLDQATAPQQAPQTTYSNDQIEELAMEMIERTSYDTAATEAANLALETGDNRLHKAVFDNWRMEDEYAAQNHIADFRAWQRAAEVTPQPDSTLAEIKAEAAMKASMEKIASERGVDTMKLVNAHADEVWAQAEPALAQMLESDDAATREFGLRVFADRALLLAAKNGASNTGPTPSAAQRKLAGASVATGALSPPGASPTGTPQSVEEAITAFKKELMETDTTSVADGLTYGPAR